MKNIDRKYSEELSVLINDKEKIEENNEKLQKEIERINITTNNTQNENVINIDKVQMINKQLNIENERIIDNINKNEKINEELIEVNNNLNTEIKNLNKNIVRLNTEISNNNDNNNNNNNINQTTINEIEKQFKDSLLLIEEKDTQISSYSDHVELIEKNTKNLEILLLNNEKEILNFKKLLKEVNMSICKYNS